MCAFVGEGGKTGKKRYWRRRQKKGLSSFCIETCVSLDPPPLPHSQVDSTSSMDAYIRAAQESIHGIITRLACDDGVSVRFALISYRDHAPQVVCVFQSVIKCVGRRERVYIYAYLSILHLSPVARASSSVVSLFFLLTLPACLPPSLLISLPS